MKELKSNIKEITIIAFTVLLFGFGTGAIVGSLVESQKAAAEIKETRQILHQIIESQHKTDTAVVRALQGANESLYEIHKLKEQSNGMVQ